MRYTQHFEAPYLNKRTDKILSSTLLSISDVIKCLEEIDSTKLTSLTCNAYWETIWWRNHDRNQRTGIDQSVAFPIAVFYVSCGEFYPVILYMYKSLEIFYKNVYFKTNLTLPILIDFYKIAELSVHIHHSS